MAGERVKARISLGLHGRPEWVHHADREVSWRVLEVVETRHRLVVEGPLPGQPGHTGRFVIDAVQNDLGEWRIAPNDTAYPAGFRDLTVKVRLARGPGCASCWPLAQASAAVCRYR